VQIEIVTGSSDPDAIQIDPFQVIPDPIPPENGLLSEEPQVIASRLYTIQTLLSKLWPTATHKDPFQATAEVSPAPPALKGSMAVVQF
jgi:hypothetical protein